MQSDPNPTCGTQARIADNSVGWGAITGRSLDLTSRHNRASVVATALLRLDAVARW